MTPVAAWNAGEGQTVQHVWKLPNPTAEATTPLAEQLSMPNGVIAITRNDNSIGRRPAWREPDNGDKAVLTLAAPDSDRPRRDQAQHRFLTSLAALRTLRSDHSPAGWSGAAVTLKRDAVRLRHTHYGRHASVLLALADALTYTEPTDPMLDSTASTVLDHGLSLLSEPHVTDSAEEALLVDLLNHGWNLTPSVSEDPPQA
jgi:hypothetical protein